MDVKRIRNGSIMLLVFGGIPVIFGVLFGGLAAGIAAGIILLLLVAIAGGIAEMALHRRGGVLSNVGPDFASRQEKDASTQAFIEEKERLLAPVGWEDVYIQSHDGLALHGYYIAGNPGEKRTAVLVHGYSVRALQMTDYALYWRDTFGVNVLMPDARAHGLSQGRYTSMGYFEKNDLLQWMDYLVQRHGPKAAMALHGISMGGATVLMAGALNPPPQLRFVVEDCGYTSAWDEFVHQFRHHYHVPTFPLLFLTNLWARLRAGFWFQDANALSLAGKLHLPTLFVHGTVDQFVPTWMVHPLYKASPAQDKTLLLVPDAAHVKSFPNDPDGQYRQELSRLVQQYMPPSSM